MTDDVRIAVSLPLHPKTKKLKKRLGAEGCWSLICLFLWAGAARWEGDLTGMSDEDIELAAEWDGAPGALVAALVEVRFLDGDEGLRRIHDWQEHNPYAAAKGDRITKAKRGADARWNAERRRKEEAERMLGACPKQAASSDAHCPPAPAPAPAPAEKKEKQSAMAQGPRKRVKTPLPDNFAISDAVRTWARKNHFDRLEEHFEAFVTKARAHGYAYADWDAAFMTAVREDWAKLRVASPQPEERTRVKL